MAQPGSAIQVQVEGSNSVLLLGRAFLPLLKACMDDDIQMGVVLAMESLGDLLLISSKRIDQARDHFKPSTVRPVRHFISKVNAKAGLEFETWPKKMEKSNGLIKTFLLISASKICFTDEEISRILLEMTAIGEQTPVHQQFYPDQCSQFITAISGESDSLMPCEHYNQLVTVIRTQLPSPSHMPELFERCSPTQLGRIIADVFNAMRNTENVRVSLEGVRNGYWLAAVFTWLLPDETECSIGDHIVYGKPGSRLAIRLIESPIWRIGRWRLEEELDPIERGPEGEFRSIRFSPTQLTSCGSAKSEIAAQFGFKSDAFEEATGVLAAALVNVTYDRGRLYSPKYDNCVQLKVVCAPNFITAHGNAMDRYGWTFDSRDRTVPNTTHSVLEGIENLENAAMSTESSGRSYVDVLKGYLDKCNIRHYDRNGQPMILGRIDDLLEIIEAAIYLAGDALLACFSENYSSMRVFRPCEHALTEKYAEIIVRMISTAEPSKNGYPFSDLWMEALRASLPGDHNVDHADLAIAGNGYVAFAKVLEGVCTRKRDVSLIVTVPGVLRRPSSDRNTSGRIHKLKEIVVKDALVGRIFRRREETIQLFNSKGVYHGINPRKAPSEASVVYLIDRTKEGRVFRMTTILQNPRLESEALLSPPTGITGAPVSWIDSMEAIACGWHLSRASVDLMMRPEAERDIAGEWKETGLLQNVVWHEVGYAGSTTNLCIAMTASDEEMRFFEAGYLSQNTQLFIRHDVPIVCCLEKAIRHWNTPERHLSAIIS